MKGYLLDTNVVSEPSKPNPERKVLRWLDAAEESSLFLSVLSIGEIRRGIHALTHGAKRKRLELWLASIRRDRFRSRILAVNAAVAEKWGELMANADRAGRSLPIVDALQAATALEYELVLVTRNVTDFAGTGVEILNPWDG